MNIRQTHVTGWSAWSCIFIIIYSWCYCWAASCCETIVYRLSVCVSCVYVCPSAMTFSGIALFSILISKLSDVTTLLTRHDELFVVMRHFLMTWQRFDVMTHFYGMTYFWRHYGFLTSLRTFLSHDELVDVMTYFWCHDVFVNVMNCLTSWRTCWRYDLFLTSWRLFDAMTLLFDVFSRHDEVFYIMTNVWSYYALFDVMTHFLMSWCNFDFMTKLLTSWHIQHQDECLTSWHILPS